MLLMGIRWTWGQADLGIPFYHFLSGISCEFLRCITCVPEPC
jgi:hypothetical protein